jgi:hypothetical protein
MDSMDSLSFCIPRMSIKVTEQDIVNAFAFFNIGDVERVDFNLIHGSPGYQSVFVHMADFYYNPVSEEVRKKVFEEEQPYRVYPDLSDPNVYWILLKNKNPVTETKMNIHQIADMMQKQQKQIECQQKQIEYQEKMIDKLNEKLSKLSDLAELVQILAERKQEKEKEPARADYNSDDDDYLAR